MSHPGKHPEEKVRFSSAVRRAGGKYHRTGIDPGSCADVVLRGMAEHNITPIYTWNSSYGFYLSGIFRPLLRGMGLWCIIKR